MNLKNKTLDLWLEKQKKKDFPGHGDIDYYGRYVSIENHLNKHIHRHVTAIASIKDGGYLTDHGPDHIKNVIRKASELVNSPEFEITPYEVYLLLVAIHLHDVGHIKDGRYQHEINTREVMVKIGSIIGKDNAEKKYICDIAEAHGGNILGNKDKISHIPEKEPILGFPVRLQLLASILRFADELSDDRTRAALYLMEEQSIPKPSEVFHHYAYALHSVRIVLEGKVVEMHFNLNKKNVFNKYGKNSKEVYLLDEIYERTLKTYCECIYCMRFIPTAIQIKSVKVKIEFIDDSLRPFREPIVYQLAETGYPNFPNNNIFDMCPEKLRVNGENLTGIKLKELLEKNQKGEE